jgi:hypothetical protein
MAVGLVVMSVPARAQAYDVLAKACETEPLYCQTAPIAFDETDALPIEWSVDTGWVPPGSDLQVHLVAAVHASTRLALSGALETSWPDALTLRTPGDAGGGLLGIHYGVEVVAEGQVQISVLGQTFSWTGDIPYVPQVDFVLDAEESFDAWGFAPGVTLTASTDPQKVASVGLGSIIGASIPGIDGGFELDVALEIEASYVTERMVITDARGELVAGGFITEADGETLASSFGDASVELDVRPEGRVDYAGTLHLIPTMYVELLGKKMTMPVADVPTPLPETSRQWAMAPKRVHVPLPDLEIDVAAIDFGEVLVGDEVARVVEPSNAGEAELAVEVVSSDAAFAVASAALSLAATEAQELAVSFAPDRAGAFSATLLLSSNDPDEPAQVVALSGTGIAHEVEPPPEVDGAAAPDADGGCGCSTIGDGGTASRVWLCAAVAGLAWAQRRRRITA